VHRLFEGQGQREKKGHIWRVLTTVKGTLACVLAPERALEGNLALVLTPKRALLKLLEQSSLISQFLLKHLYKSPDLMLEVSSGHAT